LKADFNLVDSFRIFDIKALGSFTSQNFEDGLRQNLEFSDFLEDDIYMFFRRVDKQNVGHITFRQFGDIILPYSEEYAQLVIDRPNVYSRMCTESNKFFT
jgi:hypothetical protein